MKSVFRSNFLSHVQKFKFKTMKNFYHFFFFTSREQGIEEPTCTWRQRGGS